MNKFDSPSTIRNPTEKADSISHRIISMQRVRQAVALTMEVLFYGGLQRLAIQQSPAINIPIRHWIARPCNAGNASCAREGYAAPFHCERIHRSKAEFFFFFFFFFFFYGAKN